MLNKTPLNKINAQADTRRWPLLWRTVFLLTLFVVLSQIVLYIWIQRSVKGHFEEMDAEIITHAAFNLRQRLAELDTQNMLSSPIDTSLLDPLTLSAPIQAAPNKDEHLHSSWLNYDLKMIITNKEGQLLVSIPSGFSGELPTHFDLLPLWQDHQQRQFILKVSDRNYRAVVIRNQQVLALIALPIDIHHQYLLQFNRQLSLILMAITLLLISIAAFSVYWGFAPLSTIIQRMQDIHPERLDERIKVSEMPLELRPLAESYNLMMTKLEDNFDSLLRFSDNIAHELRTPIATLSTQTQVMLSKPRSLEEYTEQLHHQHETLEQLSSLINNMLLLAKTQKGLSGSQLSPVDMDVLLTKLIDYFELIAEERGITFDQSGEFGRVLGDEGLLQRLFANLLSNAIYYAASDSVIYIKAITDTSDKAKIIITNQLAKPLTQDEADKLFERFYRYDQTKTMHTGSGLGLSIVQAIATAHNGKVSITINDVYYFQVDVVLPTPRPPLY